MIAPLKHLDDVHARQRRDSHIMLAHGGGGQLTDELIHEMVMPRLGNGTLKDLLDSGIVKNQPGGRIAMTIDSYVVQPLRFPGGDIGRLAISGTVNDLAVCGAVPMGIALSLILAEGLEKSILKKVLDSIELTAQEAGVHVVTGDTKVVGKNHADGLYITTAGVGHITSSASGLSPELVRPGDVILINGPIADHGLAVMLAREMPQVRSVLKSDVAPLNRMIQHLLHEAPDVVFMRDPTRAGLAGVVADLASRTGWRIVLDETRIPINPETLHAAEMLGLDPLEVANEGKVVVVVRPESADAALAAMRSDPLGKAASMIGVVEDVRDGICELQTTIGGRRILQKPYGEQLPRIC
jgi:hydrogenase expression/formation protein HypE